MIIGFKNLAQNGVRSNVLFGACIFSTVFLRIFPQCSDAYVVRKLAETSKLQKYRDIFIGIKNIKVSI